MQDEHELVPELPSSQLARRMIRDPKSWYRQQLIKLAAVAEAESPFALVLDADIIAVRPVADSDLIIDGRALRHRRPMGAFPQWHTWAARVLEMDPIDYRASVTPSVLSREALVLLAEHVAHVTRLRGRRTRAAAWIPGLRRHVVGWRGRLISALPWTEYQLYDTFLVGSGNFERFHISPDDVHLDGNTISDPEAFGAWVPGPATEKFTYFFSVVQSNMSIPVAPIEEKLRAARLL